MLSKKTGKAKCGSINFYSLIIIVFHLTVNAQKFSASTLYKSSVFTPPNSFTNDVEGPAVDKKGIVYAVNFQREGTIGQITPSGHSSVFLQLPEGSIANGIRFDSHGNMMIADYAKHNIFKVEVNTRKINIFAHEPKMHEPNDLAIDSKDRLYASDPDFKTNTGRIWRIDINGKVTLLDTLGAANGIELSPDEKTLYVGAGREILAYDGINPRVVIGSLIIKHMCDLSDRETVEQIQENMYMQYFLGFSSFSDQQPFDASLFVEFRKRLGAQQINAINEKILNLSMAQQDQSAASRKKDDEPPANTPAIDAPKQGTAPISEEPVLLKPDEQPSAVTHQGQLIVDATACPQDISFPTDLNLLDNAREKSEELIDILYSAILHKKKPRTYRKVVRKMYLKTAQKKVKSKKEIRSAIRKQLGFVNRNIKNILKLLKAYQTIPLNAHQYKYLLVIQTLYDQQALMYKEKSHRVEHRIVSIHQPHVRPIVRGKTNVNVEFGAKINVSLINGFAFLEDLSWDAFNEGTRLIKTVEQYKARFGYYPKEVLADKIYCNRTNRAKLKELQIVLVAKALGRPRALSNHIRPGQRNPIEGKFGQAKTAYGLNRIKARLEQTSSSWIAAIIMVLNLVKLTGHVPFCLILSILTYSAAQLQSINMKIKRLENYNSLHW